MRADFLRTLWVRTNGMRFLHSGKGADSCQIITNPPGLWPAVDCMGPWCPRIWPWQRTASYLKRTAGMRLRIPAVACLAVGPSPVPGVLRPLRQWPDSGSLLRRASKPPPARQARRSRMSVIPSDLDPASGFFGVRRTASRTRPMAVFILPVLLGGDLTGVVHARGAVRIADLVGGDGQDEGRPAEMARNDEVGLATGHGRISSFASSSIPHSGPDFGIARMRMPPERPAARLCGRIEVKTRATWAACP